MKLDELYDRLDDIDLTAEYISEFTESMQAVVLEGNRKKLNFRLPSMLYCLEKLNEELEKKRERLWQWLFGEEKESEAERNDKG